MMGAFISSNRMEEEEEFTTNCAVTKLNSVHNHKGEGEKIRLMSIPSVTQRLSLSHSCSRNNEASYFELSSFHSSCPNHLFSCTNKVSSLSSSLFLSLGSHSRRINERHEEKKAENFCLFVLKKLTRTVSLFFFFFYFYSIRANEASGGGTLHGRHSGIWMRLQQWSGRRVWLPVTGASILYTGWLR